MKKFSKRFLGWLLCICMVLSYLPAVSLVANAADDWSGMSRTETHSTYGDEEITLTLQTSDYYLFGDSSTEWSVTEIDFNYFQLDDQYQQLELGLGVTINYISGEQGEPYSYGWDVSVPFSCGAAIEEVLYLEDRDDPDTRFDYC